LTRALKTYSARTGVDCPPAVLMQNHGLIVCGDTAAEITERTKGILGRIEAYQKRLPPEEAFGKVVRVSRDQAHSMIDVLGPTLRALLAEGDRLKVVTFDDSDVVLSLAGGENGRPAAIGGPLTPDQIVYCCSYPMWFEPEVDEAREAMILRLRDAIMRHREKTDNAPLIVLVKGLGLFGVGDDFSQADVARLAYIESIKVMSGARRMGGIRVLPDRDREFIEHWEVEAYRRGVAAGGGHKGQASGLIAVVTEAASGGGLEIVESLGEEGAHVMICDVEVEGCREHAEKISARCGTGRSKALAIDATNGKSIADAFHEVVRTYGGFDIVISNAGAVQAGVVKTQPELEFDPATAANCRDFPVVLKAAPILALQHAAKQDYWSDIIEINSESDQADASRKGCRTDSILDVIGFTRSFVLELAKAGIRVGAIYLRDNLDDPLRSDSETGLIVKCLSAGEVAEAKTVEDVRRFYESTVPMNRDCAPTDVVKAIYYLIAQPA
jgi:NAD(P)-dependent dehydrogenase (short-subunit alcohol dehydrogenase family)